MKKMFGLVVVLLILYIVSQIAYSFFVNQQVKNYVIKVDNIEYRVKEIFTSRHKSPNRSDVDANNYYYEISQNDKLLFNFKLIGNYTGVKEFLKDLVIYNSNNMICAYPVFKEKVSDIDVICNNQDKRFLYGSVRGQYAELDTFIANLKTAGYNHPSWSDYSLTTEKVDKFDLYTDNIREDQNLAIWEYKGFYRVAFDGKKWYALNSNDQYDPTLTVMVNQYYVVPDYKEKNYFTSIYITNLISGSIENVPLGANISYDSLIQGVVDNKIYIVDRVNKVQYSIDIYKKEVKITGDTMEATKYYTQGKWEDKTIYEVIDNNLVFQAIENIPETLNQYSPLYVAEVGGDTDGYYYLYLKENNNVTVYRVDKQKTDILTKIFTIPSVKNIKYVANDIYFISNDTLYYYRDSVGLKPLVKYNEFVFNKNNLYNIYVK